MHDRFSINPRLLDSHTEITSALKVYFLLLNKLTLAAAKESLNEHFHSYKKKIN